MRVVAAIVIGTALLSACGTATPQVSPEPATASLDLEAVNNAYGYVHLEYVERSPKERAEAVDLIALGEVLSVMDGPILGGLDRTEPDASPLLTIRVRLTRVDKGDVKEGSEILVALPGGPVGTATRVRETLGTGTAVGLFLVPLDYAEYSTIGNGSALPRAGEVLWQPSFDGFVAFNGHADGAVYPLAHIVDLGASIQSVMDGDKPLVNTHSEP